MTDNPLFRCDDKIAYPSRSAAKAARKRLKGMGYIGMNDYRCDKCGLFHLGHRSKYKGRRKEIRHP